MQARNQAEQSHEVTELLGAWSNGDKSANDRLFALVYRALRSVAERHLRGERREHTLDATALVHEVYLRMINQRETEWQGRNHFMAIAAEMMRRVLVDHARARAADKRGGTWERLCLDSSLVLPGGETITDVLAVEAALVALAAFDPRQSKLVELRFFGGLSIEAAAKELRVSAATAKREWRLARAWLFNRLRNARGLT